MRSLIRPFILCVGGVLAVGAPSSGFAENPRALGDENSDLVFFPVTPCRILHTGLGTGAFAGPLVAGVPRHYSHNQDLAGEADRVVELQPEGAREEGQDYL